MCTDGIFFLPLYFIRNRPISYALPPTREVAALYRRTARDTNVYRARLSNNRQDFRNGIISVGTSAGYETRASAKGEGG